MTAARKPLVYVAGPITGDPWGCVRRATHAAAILGDLGCHAYLPQLSILHEIVAPEPYEHWIEHGLAMVERCDGILRLPGESPGADQEVDHALQLGIPVFVDGWVDRSVWRTAVQMRADRRDPGGTAAEQPATDSPPQYPHRCWVPGCEECDAEAGHDALVALLAAERQRSSQLDLELQQASAALDVLVRFARWADWYLEKPCRFDHDGNCQAHGLDQICPVGAARYWLAENPPPPGPAE